MAKTVLLASTVSAKLNRDIQSMEHEKRMTAKHVQLLGYRIRDLKRAQAILTTYLRNAQDASTTVPTSDKDSEY